MSNALGFDASSYQSPVTPAQLEGYSFAFTKATNGTDGVDPNFAANWAALGRWGGHRGCYHEMTAGSAQVQAEHFLAVVRDHGVRAGDLCACVASDYSGVTSAEVAGFCAEVKAALRTSPVLVYTSLSVGATLTSCTGYGLWSAWPDDTPPASVHPWSRWTFWQRSFGGARDGGDVDEFNGTAAELDAWIATYAGTPGPLPVRAAALFQGEDDMIQLGQQGNPTAIPCAGYAQIYFCTVDGASGSFPPATLSVNWHAEGEEPVAVPVNPGSVWPALNIPAGVRSVTVFREDKGTHMCSAGLLNATGAAALGMTALNAATVPLTAA